MKFLSSSAIAFRFTGSSSGLVGDVEKKKKPLFSALFQSLQHLPALSISQFKNTQRDAFPKVLFSHPNQESIVGSEKIGHNEAASHNH